LCSSPDCTEVRQPATIGRGLNYLKSGGWRNELDASKERTFQPDALRVAGIRGRNKHQQQAPALRSMGRRATIWQTAGSP